MSEVFGMKVRTSETHPLQIAKLDFNNCNIGLSLCPGKKQQYPISGYPWDRSLATDLQAISDSGFDIVVSLIEEHEFVDLEVTKLQQGETKNYDMEWISAPIPDQGIPEKETFSRLNLVLDSLNEGQSLFVHCMGGLGRAGIIVAWLLTHHGFTSIEAIQKVREVRPGAIENNFQEDWVHMSSGKRL